MFRQYDTGLRLTSEPGFWESKFALVPILYDTGWPEPELQHAIVVTCPHGKCVTYCPDGIVVKGKLTVGVTREDGSVVGIF
jgi:hypothetical protein